MHQESRGSARQRGYDAQWDKAARIYKRQFPLCCGCKAAGRIEPATVVDHIVPHKGNADLFWDSGNWQPSCDWHHNVVKAALERQWLDGAIAAAELRLDSKAALKLARQTQRAPAFTGIDGWSIG